MNSSINTNAEPQPVTQPELVSNPGTQPQPAQQNPTALTTGYASPANPGATVASATPSAAPNAQHPLVKHASVLHDIAETLAGGPRYQTTIDPQSGQRSVSRIPLDRKDIGMAIAMSAISGALSGIQAKGPNANAQAAGLGFNAVAKRREQTDEQTDQKSQQDFINQQSAFAANLRTRNLAQEIGTREEKAHEDWITAHAPTVAAIRKDYASAIIGDNLSEAQVKDPKFTAQAMKNGWVAIPVGSEPRFDAAGNHYSVNGEPMFDNRYMVVDGSKIAIPAEVIQANQKAGLAGFVNGAGAPINLPNLELRLSTITDYNNKRFTLENEQRDLNDYYDFLNSKGVKGADGKPLQAPNVQQAIKENPTLSAAITGEWARHFGDTPGSALRAMKDNVAAKGPISNLYGGQNLLDQYENLKAADKESTKKQADVAAEQNGPLTDDKAASILSDPNSSSIQRTRASSFQKIKTTQKATEKQNELAADQAVKQGNPADAGKLMYQGTLTLSELKARNATPKFIEDATNAALALANAKGESNWTPQVGEAQFNAAKSPGNVQFFGSANSLLDKSGTLDQLADQHAKLNNGRIPLFNKWKDYASYQSGDPALAGFMQTAVGVADDYAKVMGGGTGSDTSRLQVMQSFANAHNPQQMAAAIDAARNAVTSQVSARIGNNRVMRQMYGQNLPSAQRVFPAGAQPILRNGQPVGYILNNQRVNF
jgi:hypothetical protein